MENICFIIGSPRSGTTIISEVLGRHPDIAQFYEPYFIWERHTGTGIDDVRTAEQATSDVIEYIDNEFNIFLKKSGKTLIVEKTPENSFRIPFINKIFPNARWIHALRDGRDATVSINREWIKRKNIAQNKKIKDIFYVIWKMLERQPYWRNRLQAIKYEITQRAHQNSGPFFNKAKWGGNIGWGPRFPGWKYTFSSMDDLLIFNALQWKYSVEAVEQGFEQILPNERTLEIRYENFVKHPDSELEKIFRFLNISNMSGIADDLTTKNIGQWKTVLNKGQKNDLLNTIGDKLYDLGYKID